MMNNDDTLTAEGNTARLDYSAGTEAFVKRMRKAIGEIFARPYDFPPLPDEEPADKAAPDEPKG